MSLRQQIVAAVLQLITGVQGLPVAPAVGLDDPRSADYLPVQAGQEDPLHFLTLLDESCERRPGCPPLLGGDGVVTYDWDLKLVAAYSVRTVDAATRLSQRDAGIAAITGALLPAAQPEAQRRQLGGLVNWFWIEPAELPTDVYDGDVQLGVARIPLTVWFSANDPSA